MKIVILTLIFSLFCSCNEAVKEEVSPTKGWLFLKSVEKDSSKFILKIEYVYEHGESSGCVLSMKDMNLSRWFKSIKLKDREAVSIINKFKSSQLFKHIKPYPRGALPQGWNVSLKTADQKAYWFLGKQWLLFMNSETAKSIKESLEADSMKVWAEFEKEIINSAKFMYKEVQKFERGPTIISVGITKENVIKALPKTEIKGEFLRDVLKVPNEEIRVKDIWTLMYGSGSAFGTTGQIRITFSDNKVIMLEDKLLALP